MCFDLCPSIAAMAVCLELLSCWKVNLHPSLKSFATSNWFYISSNHLPLALLCFPAKDQHSHTMMLPPLCFTVWNVCSRRCAVLFFSPHIVFFSLDRSYISPGVLFSFDTFL
ncbi:hypothetical protein ATANTOWER_014976 [Ataeniobius toweri]|uniref:Secreted protein n=1 Tax=Ataeniobius toweri TaxID=208326 RepID=A0ABU7BQM8_9TELE|nr:hypothetical protein [Ataeniobius toweri]